MEQWLELSMEQLVVWGFKKLLEMWLESVDPGDV